MVAVTEHLVPRREPGPVLGRRAALHPAHVVQVAAQHLVLQDAVHVAQLVAELARFERVHDGVGSAGGGQDEEREVLEVELDAQGRFLADLEVVQGDPHEVEREHAHVETQHPQQGVGHLGGLGLGAERAHAPHHHTHTEQDEEGGQVERQRLRQPEEQLAVEQIGLVQCTLFMNDYLKTLHGKQIFFEKNISKKYDFSDVMPAVVWQCTAGMLI